MECKNDKCVCDPCTCGDDCECDGETCRCPETEACECCDGCACGCNEKGVK